MTNDEAIEILIKEKLCVDRGTCKREECANCDLVMPEKEPILEAYRMAINSLRAWNRLLNFADKIENDLNAKSVHADILRLIYREEMNNDIS